MADSLVLSSNTGEPPNTFFNNRFTRKITSLGTSVGKMSKNERLLKIKKLFVDKTIEARKQQENDAEFNTKYGTQPTIVLPVHGTNASDTSTDTVFTVLQFSDTVLKGVTSSRDVIKDISLTVASTITVAGMIMPPLICIPVVVSFAVYLQFQSLKNKELLYAYQLIFSICQDMLPDLIRMYNFYTKVNEGKDNDNKIENPFIAKTMKKITDLQVYIISLSEHIVIEFMALSFGIIDDFGEKFNASDVVKLKKIFGEQGFSDGCHLPEKERRISDDVCDGNSSERSFASVKRAIIHRLTNTTNYTYIQRISRNFLESSEKYRRVIDDVTVIGIMFSQASARFALDAIDHVSVLQEATTAFIASTDNKTSETFAVTALEQGENVNDEINDLPDGITAPTDVGSSGGRRKKRTRKYRR